MSNQAKNIALWMLIIIGFAYMWVVMSQRPREEEITYSELKQNIKTKNVSNVVISPDLISGGMKKDGKDIKLRRCPLPIPISFRNWIITASNIKASRREAGSGTWLYRQYRGF